MAGAAFQGLFRNPLADPYLMGSASGAAFGVTLAVSLAGTLGASYSTSQIFAALPSYVTLFAFAGAVLAVAVTLLLSGGAARTHDLILAGVVVGAVLTGLTTYLMLKDADRIRAVMAYTLGNFSFMGWDGVRAIALYLALSLPFLWILGRTLNALSLGEETARSLGLPLGGLKLLVIGLATLLTAASVAYAGIIGFVGLVAPHALRRLVGGDYRALLPASALGGAVLLTFADLLARVLTRPAELPVGVVTTLLGGPFFLYLLWRGRRNV
jgi:iron complex transport system permease protein